MLSIFEVLLELPDQQLDPYQLIRLARCKGLLTKQYRQTSTKTPDDDGVFFVPLIKSTKTPVINPLTGRLKNKKRVSFLKTTIEPSLRTLKNIPRYATKKLKVKNSDWLCLTDRSRSSHSVGKSTNGKWYGWSHRAIFGFGIGDTVKPGSIGNKYEYGDDVEKMYNKHEKSHGVESADIWRKQLNKFKPYIIMTDDEAFEHADRFSKDVS